MTHLNMVKQLFDIKTILHFSLFYYIIRKHAQPQNFKLASGADVRIVPQVSQAARRAKSGVSWYLGYQ